MRIGSNMFAAPIRWLDRGSRTLSVTAGAINQAPLEKLPAALATFLSPVKSGWVLSALAIATPILVTVRKRTDKVQREDVLRVLNDIRDKTFKRQKLDREQHGRVTLFRYRSFTMWRFPWFGGWLVPYERSGSATRKTDAIFRAPDDGERAEGVAGKVWSCGASEYVGGLPDLRARGATDEQFRHYGEKSFCDAKRLRRKPPQARSLMGIPVDVDNKRWGVIVIDCVKENFDHKRAQSAFGPLASHLAGCLKRN